MNKSVRINIATLAFLIMLGLSAGVDCAWYFEDLFQSTKTVDWRLTVSQVRSAEKRGWVQASPGVPFELISDDPEEEDEDDDGDENDERDWEVEVLLRRKGELRLPMEVELTFAGGRTERQHWTRAEQEGSTWKRIVFSSSEKLQSAVIDPDRGIYLDLDMSDNQWFDKTEKVRSLRGWRARRGRHGDALDSARGMGGFAPDPGSKQVLGLGEYHFRILEELLE